MSSTEGYSHGFASSSASVQETGRRTADVLVDLLVEAGVEVIFGLPGGAIAPLHDALMDRPEVRVVTTRHEAGAMFAAQAYARRSGKVGVVLVTSGPGILNAMTGLASAHCDGMPLVVLVGEVPRSVFGRRALQEGSAHHLDIVSTCKPITKMAAEVPSSDVAPGMLKRAITTALSGRRGPVVLTLPLDVTSKRITPAVLTGDVSVAYGTQSQAMGAALDETSRILGEAERPVMFVGSGARWGDGPRRVRALAERLGCPVMTTPKAKGVFPESHPLSLGVFGYGGHPSTTRYLTEGVDVMLAVGTGLGDVATNGWSPLLVPKKHFVQIDTDAAQIGRNYPVTHGVVGDAAVVLRELAARAAKSARPAARFGVERHTDAKREEYGPEGKITPQRAIWELQQAMPKGTVFTCDIGEHLLFGIHYLQVDDPHGFLIMTGLGSMGSSVAGAIGARLADAQSPTVAICGDGCFSMNLGDVAVAAREGVPLIVAVLNDERYGMVEIGHEAVYGRRPEYPAGPMDIALMAKSVGAEAVTIERSHQITELGLGSRRSKTPLVLDIRIDRQVRMPKNGRNENMRASIKKTLPN